MSLAQAALRIAIIGRLMRLTQHPDLAAYFEAEAQGDDASSKIREIGGLHQAIGMALTNWADMELSLVTIAANTLETPRERAGVVMYSIVNFNVWLSVIGELLPLDERYVHLKSQWNKIAETLRRLKDTRDRLAHHTARHLPDKTPLLRAVLAPAGLDVRQKSVKYLPLTFHQIMEFSHSVSNINRSLEDFIEAMTVAFSKHGPLPRTAFEVAHGQDLE